MMFFEIDSFFLFFILVVPANNEEIKAVPGQSKVGNHWLTRTYSVIVKLIHKSTVEIVNQVLFVLLLTVDNLHLF